MQHVQKQLAQLGKDYQDKSIGVVAISSNDADTFPEDGPLGLREQAAEYGFIFPYFFDESQEVARSYSAACTPDFFLFDRDRKLVYRGQLDDSRPGNERPVTGKDLREAIDATLQASQSPPTRSPVSAAISSGNRNTTTRITKPAALDMSNAGFLFVDYFVVTGWPYSMRIV